MGAKTAFLSDPSIVPPYASATMTVSSIIMKSKQARSIDRAMSTWNVPLAQSVTSGEAHSDCQSGGVKFMNQPRWNIFVMCVCLPFLLLCCLRRE